MWAELDRAEVRWCRLRGSHVDPTDSGVHEIDLLVAPEDLGRFETIVAGLGHSRRWAWGHGGHRFFVRFDADSSQSLKLDVVARLRFGGRNRPLAVPAFAGFISRRRREGSMWVLDPVDGMTALVLHCVLDKGYFREHHQREVVALHGEIHANRELAAVAENLWAEAGGGVLDWSTVDAAVRDRAWNRLLERRAALSRMLAGRNRFEYGLWVFEGWAARCLRWAIAPITRSGAGRSTGGKR